LFQLLYQEVLCFR